MNNEQEYFITLKRFCELTSLGMTTAREIAFSKVMCEAGISVRINPLKKNGAIRINWPLFVEFTKKHPTESHWVKSKTEQREEIKALKAKISQKNKSHT